ALMALPVTGPQSLQKMVALSRLADRMFRAAPHPVTPQIYYLSTTGRLTEVARYAHQEDSTGIGFEPELFARLELDPPGSGPARSGPTASGQPHQRSSTSPTPESLFDAVRSSAIAANRPPWPRRFCAITCSPAPARAWWSKAHSSRDSPAVTRSRYSRFAVIPTCQSAIRC